MIINLPNTTTRDISKRLVTVRESGGEVTTGRVLTLIIVVSINDDYETFITAANEASQEHPSRILVLLTDDSSSTAGPSDNDDTGNSQTELADYENLEEFERALDAMPTTAQPERSDEETAQPSVTDDVASSGRVDAEIRMGGDAGAAEVVVMKLYGAVSQHLASVVMPILLPDTPIVAWWPASRPPVPATDPIGRLAGRRITDSLSSSIEDGIFRCRSSYAPGDSDLAWSRITQWRGILASALDQPPFSPIRGVTIAGPSEDPSVDIAGGWLADRLGMNVTRESTDSPKVPLDSEGRPTIGVQSVTIHRDSGDLILRTFSAHTLTITREGSGRESRVALTRRGTADCLAEELRHLDPDVIYAQALRGLFRVHRVDAFDSDESYAPDDANDSDVEADRE